MGRFFAMEGVSAATVTEPVPNALKTMRLDRVFWSHFSPNLGPGGWVVGVLLVHLGLGLGSGIAAILLGNLIGALPVAFAAAIGPVTGLPQMEASRRVLGRRGIRLPSFLNWIYCIGWDAVNNVPAAAALVALLALAGLAAPFWLALAVLAGLQMIASIYGHDMVQGLQKYLGGLLLVTFAVIGGLDFLRAGSALLPHPADAPATLTVPTFLLAVAILASFNLSWATYSSDYTRYLPADTDPKRVVRLSLAALLASAIPFQLLGLVTAGSVGEASPTAVIAGLQHAAGGLGPVVLAAIALSSISGNSFNDNTASYSLISAGIRVPRCAGGDRHRDAGLPARGVRRRTLCRALHQLPGGDAVLDRAVHRHRAGRLVPGRRRPPEGATRLDAGCDHLRRHGGGHHRLVLRQRHLYRSGRPPAGWGGCRLLCRVCYSWSTLHAECK